MTMPINCSGYEASSPPLDTPRVSTGVHDTVMNAWGAILWRAWSGSTGIVSPGSGYGSLLPRVGSSSSVVDRRPASPIAPPRGAVGLRGTATSSFAEQIQELQAALSINKSQLARILRVTRPTLYDWLQGREPNAANAERLRTLLRMLARAGVSGANPLNARFVRRPVGIQDPSLVDLLCEERIDEDRVLHVIGHAQALADSASRRRTAREERLHRLVFDNPGDEQRRRQLATNMALRKWPGR